MTPDDAEALYYEPPEPGVPVDPPDRPVVYTDVVARTADRRPIVPAAFRSRDQRAILLHWARGYVFYWLLYHALHSPKYLAKVAFWAPVGLVRGTARLLWWARAEEGNWSLRQHAASRNSVDDWLKLDRTRERQSSWRGPLVIFLFVLLIAAVVVLQSSLVPRWAPWAAGAVAVVVLARIGRPADKPITDRVSTAPGYRKLTAELVRAALLATGYGKEPGDYAFDREIIREGPGYSALVRAPHGVTAAMLIERADRAAARLHLPLDQVWMKVGRHAGQLELFVGDEPMSAATRPAWPLLKRGRVDIFEPVPIGHDERDQPILALLMFTNWIIGAIPRMGKTFVLRLLLLAASLDPRVKLGAADLKGTGDLSALKPAATWYFVGDDEDELSALMSALRGLREELRRRAAVLRDLPRDICPENKVTPQLAGMAHLGLAPVVFGIDECQVLFTDPEHGKDAEVVCTDLIKRGPAVGINLLLATQRPDSKSLPTGISGNAGTRFCLRVTGQMENDMVLGTSMYRNGVRATMFTNRAKGVGWLVGAMDEPTVVATSYVDGPAAERIVARAVELRGGPVLAEPPQQRARAYSLLEDLRAVWPAGEEAAWSELLLDGLARLRPDHYGGWDVRAFGAAARAAGVDVVSVHRKLGGKGVTKYGVRLAALLEAIEARPSRSRDSRGSAIDSGGASPPNDF